MLAQLADIFDQATWNALLAIGLSAPLLGFIVGWVLRGTRYLETRWKWIAGYYGIAMALCLLVVGMGGVKSQATASVAYPFLILMLFGLMSLGPMLGLVLAGISAKGPRYPEGHCQICGYNLTGNVSGRCSECGTDIDHAAQQEELLQQRAKQRVPWLFGGFTVVMLAVLPLVNQSSSSFLIGAWALAMVILLPLTILLFLRRI